MADGTCPELQSSDLVKVRAGVGRENRNSGSKRGENNPIPQKNTAPPLFGLLPPRSNDSELPISLPLDCCSPAAAFPKPALLAPRSDEPELSIPFPLDCGSPAAAFPKPALLAPRSGDPELPSPFPWTAAALLPLSSSQPCWRRARTSLSFPSPFPGSRAAPTHSGSRAAAVHVITLKHPRHSEKMPTHRNS